MAYCSSIPRRLAYYLHFLAALLLFPWFLITSIINALVCGRKEDQIQGRLAVITGAAQGLGRQIALELAKRGCHIAVVDTLQKAAENTAKYLRDTHNIQAKAYLVDITDYHQLLAFRSEVLNDFGVDVTILINNATIFRISDSNPVRHEEIQNMVTLNFTSHLWMNQLFLTRMKELNRGHIMAISSLSALFPADYLQIYAPTKSAIRAYMASLRAHLKCENYKIRVTTIMPTFLNSRQYEKDFVDLSGYESITPCLDSTVAAEQAVKALLQGLEEISLPRVASLTYKLLEFGTTWQRDWFVRCLSPKFHADELHEKLKQCSDKNGDIQTSITVV
uniref:Uncharacterized protein n=1 Tax=Stomoxys calcitrans TaxID=35570 RepID=A0A1I8Q4Z8_STOCA